jgi:hypothetical protein
MKAKKHAKPIPVVAVWSAHHWEMCPKCQQVREKGKQWKRACISDKRASRYMGT